jgi:type I restriction enzyme, S subunit
MKTNLLLDVFTDVPISYTPRKTLQTGAFRLDASFYSPSAVASQTLLASSGLRLERCGQVADIYCSNLRERTFVSGKHGIPLLGGHNLGTEHDRDLKYVSRLFTPQFETEKLLTGDVLLSSAGTVGLFDFVYGNHEGRMASQHIIRVRAHLAKILPGYLYTYLSSPLALSMVTNQSAGSVIVTLYTEHLADFPVPRLTVTSEERIHDLITRSFTMRKESRELQDAARIATLQVNGLPPLPDGDEDTVEVFSLSAPTISSDAELRLEAHFHNPIARAALAKIRKSPSPRKTVGQLSHEVIMGGRFKRNYVEAKHGTPFLSGSNIIQIRPTDLKHLSNSQTEDLRDLLIKKGWILVTCSGTIGRTAFVWHNFEEYAASQHILRVIPDKDQVDPGYLYAFLASPYGYEQIIRFRHGSVIDEITDQQLSKVNVPLPAPQKQKQIGDKVRLAYEKRAEALKLEDQAQEILLREIKGQPFKEM